MSPDRPCSRRAALGLGAALGAATVLGACAGEPGGMRAVLATGGPQGVYHRLGAAMIDVWRAELGADTREVASEGSVDNVGLVSAGRADVGFCAVDVAADAAARDPSLRALARVHDDAIHVVVPASSAVTRLADLRGRRVSIGAPNSGVIVIAPRLLAAAGLDARRDLAASPLGLGDSIAALRAGAIDAFLWSGGLPTTGIDALAAAVPIRLLDLAEQVDAVRRAFPVYDDTTVPAGTYGLSDPVTTLSVRNVLLVPAAMPPTTAQALTRVLLDRADALAAADAAGRSVDPRTAIGTVPVVLHDGAAAAYRAAKPY